MYLIILGGGGIGSSLLEMAVADGHNVVLIERDPARAKTASDNYNAVVLNADIAQGGIFDEAGADQADALVASTSDDAANLMAIFLAVDKKIPILVSIVNSADHEPLFRRLGVHVLLDPEVVVARHLYGFLRQPKLKNMTTLADDEEVFGVPLGPGSPLAGKSMQQIEEEGLLPEWCNIIGFKEDGDRSLVKPSTVLHPGTTLTVYCVNGTDDAQLGVFTG